MLASANLVAEQLASEAQLQNNLQRLQADIQQLEVWLEEADGQQSELTHQLRQSERRIDTLLKQIAVHQVSLAASQTRQQSLMLQYQKLQDTRAEQQRHLDTQLRASYKQGYAPATQLLLNLDNLANVRRTLKYYHYLNQARAEQINAYRQTLQSLAEVQKEQASTQAKLQQEEQLLQQQQQALQAAHQQQKHALQQLQEDISSEDQRLVLAKQDQQRFQSLLEQLQASLAKAPEQNSSHARFEQQQGQLHWPLRGKVLNRFGRQQQAYPLSRDGWLIQANTGSQVKSIYAGRVVFANWLKGYGLILIIDHGQGYLSLYGHNQALYRVVGDKVEQGTLLADSGSSGGSNSQTALYFSIRYKGKPLHPNKWLQ
jgi:septal ring factor EnvC (AmiA/AmiB activator)